MRLTRVRLHAAGVLLLFAGLGPACHRETPAAAPATAPASPPATSFTPQSAPGEVGPLGIDCYDAKQAKACPPDPSDPSGRKLPAHGGACRFPVCRPCGSRPRSPSATNTARRPPDFASAFPCRTAPGGEPCLATARPPGRTERTESVHASVRQGFAGVAQLFAAIRPFLTPVMIPLTIVGSV